jgi:hypothetical protein
MEDQPHEETPHEETPNEEKLHEEKPALTVVVQSWWTPALAVIMLVVGLLIGYLGRPLVNKGTDTSGDIAAVTTPVGTVSAEQVTLPTSTVDPTAVANSQKQLMDYLISNTTHFLGDPNAKVTIIEFSDYQ